MREKKQRFNYVIRYFLIFSLRIASLSTGNFIINLDVHHSQIHPNTKVIKLRHIKISIELSAHDSNQTAVKVVW